MARTRVTNGKGGLIQVSIRRCVGPVDNRAGAAFLSVLGTVTEAELDRPEHLGQKLIVALRDQGFLILPSDWLERSMRRLDQDLRAQQSEGRQTLHRRPGT